MIGLLAKVRFRSRWTTGCGRAAACGFGSVIRQKLNRRISSVRVPKGLATVVATASGSLITEVLRHTGVFAAGSLHVQSPRGP
jgi:hypothetical protein